MSSVGQNHTFIGLDGVHTVFLAGKSPYIRLYTVQMYGSGQPYTCPLCHCAAAVQDGEKMLRLSSHEV